LIAPFNPVGGIMNGMNRWCWFIFACLFYTPFLYAGTAGSTWSKIYSGFGVGRSVQETSDQGFVAAGYVSGPTSADVWVLKVDALGFIEWQKSFTGSEFDGASYVQQTSNGGYIVVGQSNSYGAGSWEGWVIRLDTSGNVEWQKTFGGPDIDSLYSAHEIAGGGFILAGETSSGTWIIKIDSLGTVQWQKLILGSGYINPRSIQQTADGGFIVAGVAELGLNGDGWVAKLDSSGNLQWQKAFGSTDPFDHLNSIRQTTDGGFILAGSTQGFGAGSFDFWILRLDSSGSIQWQKAYGTSDWETADSIQTTSDGGFIVTGVQGNGSSGNGLVLKLDSSGNIQWQKIFGGPGYELLIGVDQASDGGYILTGQYGGGALWLLKIASDGVLDATCSFTMNASLAAADSTAIVTSTTFAVSDPQIQPGTSIAQVVNTSTTVLQQCGNVPACNFEDNFEDGIVDLTKWTVLKPTFIEDLGDLVSTPSGKKSTAVSTGLFTCNPTYKIQTTMQSSGGLSSVVTLLGWYQDKRNTVELLMKEKNDKWILKYKSNGVVIAKGKTFRQIDPNVPYHVALTFDGTFLHVFLDFVEVIRLQAPITPNGITGYQTRGAPARFSNICVLEDPEEPC
jgi:hypothetical protein